MDKGIGHICADSCTLCSTSGHKQSAPGAAVINMSNNSDSGVDSCSSIVELRDKLRDFVNARDWEQFHSPKNLAMALSVETAELMEIFQWLTQDESSKLPTEKRADVKQELADVLIYLVRLADVLDVDLLDAAAAKLHANETRYPAEQVRGQAKKYTEY